MSVRTMLGSIGLIGVFGTGYAMWTVISPGEERKRDMLKNLPESNPVRMDESRRRNAIMLQMLKDAAETNDNIARGFRSEK